MKQIIPFKKELPFKTKVSEITSISLERDLEVKDETISGVFHITGDYKMNEGSINREKFSFDLPFDITLDPRYDISTVITDIEDFYYDVLEESILKVNIDLFVTAEYLPEEPISEIISIEELPKEEQQEKRETISSETQLPEEDFTIEPQQSEETRELTETQEEIIDYAKVTDTTTIPPLDLQESKSAKEESENNMPKEQIEKAENRDETLDIGTDLFSNLDNTETYTTYYVYIVKEEDTVEKIITKFEITKEDFEDYNDINNIKTGDKVIIPKKSE